MLLSVLCACALASAAGGTHIYGVDKDFNKINVDPILLKDVQPIIERLNKFKVGIHPRIGFFYGLLRKGIARHVAAVADSLYVPDRFIVHNNTADQPVNEESDDDYYEDDPEDEDKDKNNDNKNTTTTIKKDEAPTTPTTPTNATTAANATTATTPTTPTTATTPKATIKKKALRKARKMKKKCCNGITKRLF